MASQRPRIIRAVAVTDIVVLKGEARLLFDYLDSDQIKALSATTQDKNPYDIGQVYLNARHDGALHNEMFMEAAKVNPYPIGHKVNFAQPRTVYPSY